MIKIQSSYTEEIISFLCWTTTRPGSRQTRLTILSDPPLLPKSSSILKKKTLHWGAQSQANRSFVEDKFHQSIQLFEAEPDKELAFGAPAYIHFHFAMINHITNTAKVLKPHLCTFEQYPKYRVLQSCVDQIMNWRSMMHQHNFYFE